jgi:hypothetical protein
MLRKALGLPRRIAKRAINLFDGERSAPSPAPTMNRAPAPTAPPAPVQSTDAPSAPATQSKKAPPPPEVDIIPEPTPNPNAMKFTVGQKICETGSFTFSVADDEISHPVARAVLGVDGVKTVFGVNDFITVTKDESVDWDGLVPLLLSAIGTGLSSEKG